jgi:hypothetical protein
VKALIAPPPLERHLEVLDRDGAVLGEALLLAVEQERGIGQLPARCWEMSARNRRPAHPPGVVEGGGEVDAFAGDLGDRLLVEASRTTVPPPTGLRQAPATWL